jgi:hypothetical protein
MNNNFWDKVKTASQSMRHVLENKIPSYEKPYEINKPTIEERLTALEQQIQTLLK